MDAGRKCHLRIPAPELAARLAELCPRNGIDLAGAVPLPCPLPQADRYLAWVAEGRHGDLGYMTRDAEGRLDPTARDARACTLLVFAQRYTDGWPAGDPDPAAGGTAAADAPWTARVSRYARGRDYHDVLLTGIQAVLVGLAETWPGFTANASCDTGPYLEREYAWLAGLGFLGKNTCLIHERLGSGLFLGVAITACEVTGLGRAGSPQPRPLFGAVPRRRRPPAEAYLSACGSCTRCIEACPTGAIAPDGGLDAGACIATWTIEKRGTIPEGREGEQGGILFGCDVCQAVCPWNRRAASRGGGGQPQPYGPLPEHGEITLADLAVIDELEFRRRFRRTPLWRCHPEGIRRNAAAVLANLVEEAER